MKKYKTHLAFGSGLWTLFVWGYWLNAYSNEYEKTNWFINPYLSASIVAATCMLVFLRRSKGLKRGSTYDTIAAFAGTLGMGFLWCGGDIYLLKPVGILLAGGSMSWGYVRWGEPYTHMSFPLALCSLMVSVGISSFLKIALLLIPSTSSLGFVCLLPILSFILLHQSLRLQNKTHFFTDKTPCWYDSLSCAAKSLWRPGLCAAVFILSWSIVNMALKLNAGHYAFGESTDLLSVVLSHVLEITFLIALYWWAFHKKGTLSFSQLWRFIFLVMSFGLLFLGFNGFVSIVQLFGGAAVQMGIALLWLTLVDVAHTTQAHPMALFGLGYCLKAFPDYLGRANTILLPKMPGITFALLSFFALMICALFLLIDRSPDVRRIFSTFNCKRVELRDYAIIDARCEACATVYGLAPREMEVMQFLCKGRTAAYIAETLFYPKTPYERTPSASIQSLKYTAKESYKHLLKQKGYAIDVLFCGKLSLHCDHCKTKYSKEII